MMRYLKHMRVPLIIVGILLVLYLAACWISKSESVEYVRNNTACPEQRVYDYADKLTDTEEKKLEELIAKRQEQIGCDIVLVILEEPLEEYAKSYESVIGYVSEEEYVMVYADNFYDENMFGYNKPWGDGCIFVDNWDRTDSIYGYAYNWLSTSGRVEDTFSSRDISNIVDEVNSEVNSDPYKAYCRYVNGVYRRMSGKSISEVKIPFYAIIIVAVIVAAVYVCIHLSENRGKKTTIAATYVNGGRPTLNHQSDILVNTHVTRRHIQRSSSSGGGGGGGGHHTSAGGHSHGGGGGHH